MELHKDPNGDTLCLESYRIKRSSDASPAIIRARLLMKTPNDNPKEMRVRVEYKVDDLSVSTEKALGRQILVLLRNRLAPVT